MKKDPLVTKAKELFKTTIDEMVCIYDASGSIGKRYLRASVQGIPYCITVDFDTLEDGTVTIRDRDTEEQKRIPLENVPETVRKLTSGKITFDSL
jgi:glycyl-tRNA synthetase